VDYDKHSHALQLLYWLCPGQGLATPLTNAVTVPQLSMHAI